jgi:hypothetical protein
MLTRAFIAGFICGEGSFSQWEISQAGKSYKVFRFCITQHQRELALLQELRDSLGYGIVRKKSSPKNNPVYIEYMISRTKDLIKFFKEISPFLEGYKKGQADRWYQDLTEYKNYDNE